MPYDFPKSVIKKNLHLFGNLGKKLPYYDKLAKKRVGRTKHTYILSN